MKKPVRCTLVGKKMHIGFDDPAKTQGTKEEVLKELRRVRDEMKEKPTAFSKRHNS